MLSESFPPPIYSQEDPDGNGLQTGTLGGPQILIIPTVDSINFQKGYLGADGERAAIEGELQIKGCEPGAWTKVSMALRLVESAFQRQIELGYSEVELFSCLTTSPAAALPSSLPFAIPITGDTPQSIHTPQSSLVHILTARLHPSDPTLPNLVKTVNVHTRRYTSHAHMVEVSPEVYTLETPTRVEVQLPRTTFKADEPIPVYITVPPPRRELVVDEGLRLRNVRVDLVRHIQVKQDEDEDEISHSEMIILSRNHALDQERPDGPSHSGGGSAVGSEPQASSSKAPMSPIFRGSSFTTTLARSGASCRFHQTRNVQLRFVLFKPSPGGSPSDFQVELPAGDRGHMESDADCPAITQSTLLHSVSFRLNVYVSFVDMSTRTERVSTVTIPLVIIAPPAPLPEVEPWVEAAYQKKHDKPPAKTVRQDDSESSAPNYDENEAGPSMHASTAPPPFEERDAPPPFFPSEPEASTSSHLPTFLESESEILVPHDTSTLTHPSQDITAVNGEGVQFGFPASQQFDGHTDMGSASPTLPQLVMADDMHVTVDMRESGIEALSRSLSLDGQDADDRDGERPPPPPPAMDDPSDPPPSIDSDFSQVHHHHTPNPPHDPSDPPPSIDSEYRSPIIAPQILTPPPGLSFDETPDDPPPPRSANASGGDAAQPTHGQAPPPYLIPENGDQGHHVIRPPPYIDFAPDSEAHAH